MRRQTGDLLEIKKFKGENVMKKVLVFIFVVAMLVFSFTDVGKTSAAESEKFVLGTFAPLSGANAEFGEHCLQAVKLWAKEVNEKGGLLGRYKVEVVAYDDQHSAAEAVPVVTKMLANDNINACVGSQASAAILPVVGLFEKAKIPLIGNGTSPTYMALGSKFVVRGTVNQNNTVLEAAKAMRDLNIKSIGIFSLQDESGQTAGDAMEQYCAEFGIKVTTREYCNYTDTDYSGQMARLLDSQPDALFICTNSPPVPYFVNSSREMGYDGLIFSKDTAMTSQIETCGPTMDYYVSAFPSIVYPDIESAGKNEVLIHFLENFNKEYGKFPTVESPYRAYDSCLVIEEAVKIANSVDPVAIREAIDKVKIQGIQGTLDYSDGTGEPIKNVNRWIVINSKVVNLDDWVAAGKYDEYLAQREWKNDKN
jgi:branched-chain amino acid transport system substrate-binding protein